MNRNVLVILGLIIALTGSAGVTGFGVAYSHNSQVIAHAVDAGRGADAVSLNFTQIYNVIGMVITSLGGIGGITTMLIGLLKPIVTPVDPNHSPVVTPGVTVTDLQSIIAEELKRIQSGNTESIATFTAFVAGIGAAKLYFKGSTQEAAALPLLEQLLPLGAAVEWGKTK